MLPHDGALTTTKGCQEGPRLVPFIFSFPRHASRLDTATGTGSLLPPHLDIYSAGLKVRATYSITVRVHRPGLLKRSLKAQQELKYHPTALISRAQPCTGPGRHDYPECVRNTAMLPASSLGLPGDSPHEVLPPHCLPAYSPALMLELIMPYPALLSRGTKPKLQTLVHCPSGLVKAVGAVYIRSVTARLRSTTTSRIGSTSRTDTAYRPIWHATGVIPVDRQRFEVDCGVWQDCVPPDVPPSFESCGVSQAYAVEVILGVSSQLQPQTQVRDCTPPIVGGRRCGCAC